MTEKAPMQSVELTSNEVDRRAREGAVRLLNVLYNLNEKYPDPEAGELYQRYLDLDACVGLNSYLDLAEYLAAHPENLFNLRDESAYALLVSKINNFLVVRCPVVPSADQRRIMLQD